MTKKNNETKLIYAAVILVVTVLSVIIIVTGIASRAGGDETAPPVDAGTKAPTPSTEKADKTPDTSVRPDSPLRPDTSRVPDETKKPDETKDAVADGDSSAEDVMAEPTLPEFVAPARGSVAKSHSETVLVYSLTMDDYRTHSGIDIAGNAGDIVVAAADGVIRSVYEDPMWGCCITIVHEGDAVSYYKNLSEDSLDGVAVGDKVKAGDVIGAVGESALYEIADEPHLHFELKIDGVSVDPEEYFEVPEGDLYE